MHWGGHTPLGEEPLAAVLWGVMAPVFGRGFLSSGTEASTALSLQRPVFGETQIPCCLASKFCPQSPRSVMGTF